jgi:hypothetical protein
MVDSSATIGAPVASAAVTSSDGCSKEEIAELLMHRLHDTLDSIPCRRICLACSERTVRASTDKCIC